MPDPPKLDYAVPAEPPVRRRMKLTIRGAIAITIALATLITLLYIFVLANYRDFP